MEEAVRNYIHNGGEPFKVISVEKLRDGGTIFIDTTEFKFYVSKDLKTFHWSCPINITNKIADKLLISFLFVELKYFVQRRQEAVNREFNILEGLKFAQVN